MSWRNVSNTPLYGYGGVIKQAVANPGVWSGIGKAGSTIANAMMAEAEEEVQEEIIDPNVDGDSEDLAYADIDRWDDPSTNSIETEYGFAGDYAQNGGMIPQYRGGGWASGDEVQGKPTQPWDSGQEDEDFLAQSGVLDIIKKGAKGFDKKDGTGFWNKMDIDNAIGAMYGVGKVGLGAIGAGAQYVGKGINKYNTGRQNKIKAREETQRQEGYKRQQAMIDRKEQAGVQGKAHTDEQLRREMLNQQFTDIKAQERKTERDQERDPQGLYGGQFEDFKEREAKVSRLQNDLKRISLEKQAQSQVGDLRSSVLSGENSLSPFQAEDDYNANAQFNAAINQAYQKKQVSDKAMAGHVREAGDMPRPTKEMYRQGPRVIDYDNKDVQKKGADARQELLDMISEKGDPNVAGERAYIEETQRQRNLQMDNPAQFGREMLGYEAYDELTSKPEPYNFNIPQEGETDPLLPLGKKTKKTSIRQPSITQQPFAEVSNEDLENIKFLNEESKRFKDEYDKTTKTVEQLEAKQNKGRNLGQANLKALHTKERDFQLNNAMNLQGYTQQQTGTGLSHLQTGRNEPTEGGQSRRGFSGLRGKVSGWLDKIKGSFETGGYLAPRRERSYSMGGDLAQANREQEQGSQKMLMAGQQSDGQITDDTIRHNRMRTFIAELNQQSPMFIDTILQR